MQVSINWLNKYVDTSSYTAEELAEKITKSGIEVEGVHYVGQPLENVVVGYVKSKEQHPNADKLSVCQVDVGNESLQIVCGAANVAEGQYVPVALPGSVLPGDFKIKKAVLRDVESNGMICSLDELGIEEQFISEQAKEGIFVFEEEVTIGEPVNELLNMDDAVLEFDLTPNRSDCLSMIGVAYEVAAVLDKEIHLPEEKLTPIDKSAEDYINVVVEDQKLAPYYGAYMVKNVTVKASPLWMQNELLASGIRPINNIVDITNYVLLEYGQPLHAFDYDRLGTKEIVVRAAREGETIKTLDDKLRNLKAEHLLITNGQEPIAIAGVMGGANTEVHEGTKTVLLEAAYFDSLSVRKASQYTGLRSDASNRFEKGVDPNRVHLAALRALQLLEEHADGQVLTGSVIVDNLDRSEKNVEINVSEINRRLGTDISAKEIEDILRKLGFDFQSSGEDYEVSIPTRRGDISIFEDMLEEVARIYGYDHLPYTLPVNSSRPGGLSFSQAAVRNIKSFLQGIGLSETITYSLTDQKLIDKLLSPEYHEKDLKAVKLSMPLSEEHELMRLSLLPHILKSVAYNKARREADVALYEIGSIYLGQNEGGQPEEKKRLSCAITGNWLEHEWQQEKKKVDFFVMKGITDALFSYLDLQVDYVQTKLPEMHPGRCARLEIKGAIIGFIGQVHPSFAKSLEIDESYVLDLNLEKIIAILDKEPNYEQIPRYPSITRDVAFVVDEELPAAHIKKEIVKLGSPLVKSVKVFDLYEGDGLEAGKKSLAFRLIYQDPSRTLKDKEVEKSFKAIIDSINEKFGTYVRE